MFVRVLGTTALAFCIATASALQPSGGQPEIPSLSVVLTPFAEGGTFQRIEVELHLEHPNVAAGETFLRMPLTLVGCPSARYETAAIHARDAKGELTLTSVDEPSTPHGTYRHWVANRTTVGDVTVRYGTAPRAVSIATRNGPLYDFREEAGGAVGAGVYFFALPDTETKYRIKLQWDLSHMPPHSRGVWSLGEGTQETIAPAEVLARSYYAVGPVKSEPAAGEPSNFGYYWLHTPPWDASEVGSQLHSLYGAFSKFFHDEGAPFRIFVRTNPYPGLGGTALETSFMYGYGPDAKSGFSSIRSFIAHEMVHNWPALHGDKYAETAWYQEGTAEYYSAVLSWRAGVINDAEFLALINEHAEEYYTNPHRTESNEEASTKAWVDDSAEKIPYGRGFMYLAREDALIRERSGGKRSLDTLVLEIADRTKRGEEPGLEVWLSLLTRELGDGARTEYEKMVAGELVVPPANSFGPCFRPVPFVFHRFDIGFDEMRPAVVNDLRLDSTAAKAGVMNGDVVVSRTPTAELEAKPEELMQLSVKRKGQPMVLRYAPYGPPVPGWKWTRMGDASGSACRLP